MRSFVALAILAVVGSTVAAPAPAPGSFLPFTAGQGGNGGNAVSGKSGTANGGSVYTTGSGYGIVAVGSGECTLSRLVECHLGANRRVQPREVTAVSLPRDPHRVATAAKAVTVSSVAMAVPERTRSRATLEAQTAGQCTRRAATSLLDLVSTSFRDCTTHCY